MDVFVHGRLSNGVFYSAGTSTGRVVSTSCDVENLNSLRFCDGSVFDLPLRTTFKASGNYTLPWRGFRLAAVYQNLPGAERTITYVVTRAQLPQLSTVSSVNVRLNEPGSMYLERLHQLDLSAGTTLRVGKIRMSPQLELFNLFNVNSVLRETTAYPTHGRPIDIMPGRLLRLGMQMDF